MKTQKGFFKVFGYLYAVIPQPSIGPLDEAVGRKPSSLAVSLVSIGSPLLFLVLLEVLLRFWSSIFSPPPSAVMGEFWKLISGPEFPDHLLASVRRIVVGFPVGVTVGAILGIAAGSWWWVDSALGVWMGVVYSIPRYAFLPIFLVWFGIGDVMGYVFIAFASMFQAFFWARNAMLENDVNMVRAGCIDGADKLRLVRLLVFGPAASQIIEGFRIAVFSAMSVMLYVESVGVDWGIGVLQQYAQQSFQIRRGMAVLIVIAVLNMVGYQLFGLLQAAVAKKWPKSAE